jgi:hypothetical protein
MVFNTTFNNISVILWQSVLLVNIWSFSWKGSPVCVILRENTPTFLHVSIELSWSCSYGSWIHNYLIMVFNTTFNNISVILWQSVLLVKETRVPGENHINVEHIHVIPVHVQIMWRIFTHKLKKKIDSLLNVK